MLPPPPLPAPPLLSQEPQKNQWGGSQGFPNHGLIQCYLIFLQTQDPHDALGQFVWRTHFCPFVLQAWDQMTCMSFLQIWSLRVCWREDILRPRRHATISLSMIWARCYVAWPPQRVVKESCGENVFVSQECQLQGTDNFMTMI